MKTDVVLHIPHASTLIPPPEATALLPDRDALQTELLRLTDWHTDALFDLDGMARRVVYPVSRLVVDPERITDDACESMAARGMGAIYTKTTDGKTLRERVSQSERDRLLAAYYHPHHDALTEKVGDALRQFDHCLIVDCHSFRSTPLPCDLNQAADRPDICLGADSSHTPRNVLGAAQEIFEAAGWRVGINTPYSGALVPAAFYHYDWRVSSIMIGINRRLYMDERTGAPLPCFGAFQGRLQACLREIITQYRQLFRDVSRLRPRNQSAQPAGRHDHSRILRLRRRGGAG